MNKTTNIDISTPGYYTDPQLEQMIESVVGRTLQRILPVLTNLDNGTGQHSLSPCSQSTYTIAEAAEYLRISKPTMYELAKQDGFPAIRVGRKIIIGKMALDEWLNKGDSYHA